MITLRLWETNWKRNHNGRTSFIEAAVVVIIVTTDNDDGDDDGGDICIHTYPLLLLFISLLLS